MPTREHVIGNSKTDKTWKGLSKLWLILAIALRVSGLAPMKLDATLDTPKWSVSVVGICFSLLNMITVFYSLYTTDGEADETNSAIDVFIDPHVFAFCESLYYYLSIILMITVFGTVFFLHHTLRSAIIKVEKIDSIFSSHFNIDTRSSPKVPFILFIGFLITFGAYLSLMTGKLYTFENKYPVITDLVGLFAPCYYTFIVIIQYVTMINFVRIKYGYLLNRLQNIDFKGEIPTYYTPSMLPH